MVNSIKNNPAALEQLVNAYMKAMVSGDNSKATGTQSAAQQSLLQGNADVDAYISSNGATNVTEVKDDVLEMLLSMSDEELAVLAADYGVDIEGVTQTDTTEDTSSIDAAATEDSPEAAALQEEIDKLEEEKDKNYKEMEKIEAEIEDLTVKAEENIAKAAAVQEEKVKEYEKETQAAVEENINAYVEANKEGGKGMSREDLQAGIKSSLGHIPEVGDAVSAAVEANEQLNEIDSHLGNLNDLIQDTQDIEAQISSKTEQYDALKNAEEAAQETAQAQANNGCCDPIGFAMGEGEDQVKYDFIVDDGAFDSTSDFLGAEGQWSEMQALDTDGDSVVSSAELAAGNIKAVKTNADGTQEVVSLAEEFGEDFSINLASYMEGGSHSAIDTMSDTDGDGIANQNLLGTFSLNVGGEEIQGYNTLDDVDWLAENYNLSIDTEQPQVEDGIEYSEQLKHFVDLFNTTTEKVKVLRDELKNTWSNIGLTEDSLNALNSNAVGQASSVEEMENNDEITDELNTEDNPFATDLQTLEELEELEELSVA